ncbi:MAG: ATP-binding protein [Deltaproteobacteria bacterium]|nr:ATP-binding protein [Deltaproteobacteria bacterium]MBW2139203.1 ATP-binding protein [Deltaproteobacteria bacterium]
MTTNLLCGVTIPLNDGLARSANRGLRITINLALNLPFADWGNVFDSTTVATAIADRLVHNSEVLIFGGESYRRKQE